MMEAVRLRLVFEDRQLLSKSQKKEGLKRSWVLLKPHHDTISDLSAYLLRVFHLSEACPDGLVLSMEGFVLPPFESISILKEKDVIQVKRKRGPSTAIIRVRDRRKSFEVEEVAEEQPVEAGVKLLANEEFEKESGGYESEAEEGELDKSEDQLHIDDRPEKKTVSKKRKASKKLQSSNERRKRKKIVTKEDDQNKVQPQQNETSHQRSLLPEKSLVNNDVSSDTDSEQDYASTPNPKVDERSHNNSISTQSEPSSRQPQENGKRSVASSHMSGGVNKTASRSTRRKRIKRQWLREAKLKEVELHQTKLLQTDNQQSSHKDNCKFTEEHEQPDYSNNEGDDIVPVVVRPGHIRFEPSGQGWMENIVNFLASDNAANADQAIQKHEIPVETFQWNGITSKRKGQKWGKEKTAFHKRSNEKKLNQESSDIVVEEETTIVNVPIDFDKLAPCTTLPQEGDKVAYRLIELSPSWTPELSSFRVGKVSKYDPKSDKITLVQVPEYPIVFEKEGDEVQPEATFLYREDGSLEIDYSSLVDVRIIKLGNMNAAKSVAGGVRVSQASSSKPISKKETRVPSQENGKLNAWDEICEALSAKKAQLSQEDNWNKKKSPSGSSWSNRALRGSALGPTMALLRAQNGL